MDENENRILDLLFKIAARESGTDHVGGIEKDFNIDDIVGKVN